MYGILSGIVSLSEIIIQEGRSLSNKNIILMTDNKAIIRLLKKRRQNSPTVNDPKEPDVDLDLQILLQFDM